MKPPSQPSFNVFRAKEAVTVEYAATSTAIRSNTNFTYGALLRYVFYKSVLPMAGEDFVLTCGPVGNKVAEVVATLDDPMGYLLLGHYDFKDSISMMVALLKSVDPESDSLWPLVDRLIPFCNVRALMVGH